MSRGIMAYCVDTNYFVYFCWMGRDESIDIINDGGELVQAKSPVIISASRSTDIPAFYADWFFHRLDKGYSVWINPFNNVRSYISYSKTRLIVFWSKNPRPLLKYLRRLDETGIHSYIQFTLNDYEKEGLEKNVPLLQERIDTFKRLVDRLDSDRVIWRFDPMVLTDRISKDDLLEKVERIGNQFKGYTKKLVFSFADILEYKKVKANLEKNHINYRPFEKDDMEYLARGLMGLNKSWDFTVATCGEKIGLEQYGIVHNKCIDDELMIKCFSEDKQLMDFIGYHPENVQLELFGGKSNPSNKDKGQRLFCGCIASKDIGIYNTCPHKCEYCYANSSKMIAEANYNRHKQNPYFESIVGM